MIDSTTQNDVEVQADSEISKVWVSSEIVENINTSYSKYLSKMMELLDIVKRCNNSAIADENTSADSLENLVKDNINFFSGLYLVAACSYVEYFLKDSYGFISKHFHEKIEQAHIPYNFVEKYIKEKDAKSDAIKSFKIDYKEAEFSAYPEKVLKEFLCIGIKLSAPKEQFKDGENSIKSIIGKRNNIIHHSNKASNITFIDVIGYINSLIQYMTTLKDVIVKSCHY